MYYANEARAEAGTGIAERKFNAALQTNWDLIRSAARETYKRTQLIYNGGNPERMAREMERAGYTVTDISNSTMRVHW